MIEQVQMSFLWVKWTKWWFVLRVKEMLHLTQLKSNVRIEEKELDVLLEKHQFDKDFVPFQPTQTRQEKTLKLSRTLKTTKMETLNNEEESNSDILDDDLSSVSSGSEFLLS